MAEKFSTTAGADNRVSLGENSRIIIGEAIQNILRVRTGEVEEDPERMDATDNESGGYRENSRGPYGLTFNAECLWRASDNRMTLKGNMRQVAPRPVLNAGEIINVKLWIYPDVLNDPIAYYLLPIFFVERCKVSIEGVGIIRYSLSIQSEGRFYRLSEAKAGQVLANPDQ